MQPWLSKPLFVTMLLFTAGVGHASSLIELGGQGNDPTLPEEADSLQRSPSMISIDAASPPSGERTRTAPRGAQRPPHIIRGGDTAARGPDRATAPLSSQAETPAKRKHKTSSSAAPPPAPGPSVGEPE